MSIIAERPLFTITGEPDFARLVIVLEVRP